MSDKSDSDTNGELFKQMAAIHAQIADLRYRRRPLQSYAAELVQLNDELARLNTKLLGPALKNPSRPIS